MWVPKKRERERDQVGFAMVVRIASSPPCGCQRRERERDQLGFAMAGLKSGGRKP
jgi:hypothetical protein